MRRRRVVLAVTLVLVLLVVAGLWRLSPMWPGPALPAGATRLALATDEPHLVPAFACPLAALLPGRVSVIDEALVLRSVDDGTPMDIVWPAGWAAWRRDGRAELVDRDGRVIGRVGDVVDGYGGGVGLDDRAHVCIIGS